MLGLHCSVVPGFNVIFHDLGVGIFCSWGKTEVLFNFHIQSQSQLVIPMTLC